MSANRYNIHVALVEERRRMTNASRRTAAIVWLVVALSIGLPESSFADPTETKPEAAANDPDNAAGKQALDRKDWNDAVRRFKQAALHDPDD